MTFLIDTNILLYAVNASCAEHKRATGFLRDARAAQTPWCITWGIVYEFLRVATHPRVFPVPMGARQALEFLSAVLDSDEVTVLTPTVRHWQLLNRTAAELMRPAGNLFHDIETAVIMREHGVREIITADSDFLQFRFLKVTNPLL